jgi:hypothetical protein
LQERNGFLAFESALHVRAFGSHDSYPGLLEWNDLQGWRRHYPSVPRDVLFFAEDALAGQFGISPNGIGRLDPESGKYASHSSMLDEWASRVLENYNFETGWELAHKWQMAHRPLKLGERLVPKQPFVLGGEFESDNLLAVLAGEAMERFGRLYQAIRNTPDGQRVTLDFWFKA